MRVTLLSIVGIARLSPLLVIRGPLGRRDLGESNFFSVNKVYLSGGGGGALKSQILKGKQLHYFSVLAGMEALSLIQ